MNTRLEGGCQVPIGAYAEIQGEQLSLRGLVGNPDGSEVITGQVSGHQDEAVALGNALAEELLSKGAKTILDAVYGK